MDRAAAYLSRKAWRGVLVAAGVLLFGSGMSASSLVGSSGATKTPAGLPESATTYANTADGYEISYPASWSRATDAQGGLVLHIGGENAVSIRKFTLQEAVDTSNINNIRAVTDAVLSTPDARLTILASQQVSVAGLDGIYYLYNFPSGQEQGVHAHYFLFSGKEMYSTVFQALPASDFTGLAGTFDRVAKSFVVNP